MGEGTVGFSPVPSSPMAATTATDRDVHYDTERCLVIPKVTGRVKMRHAQCEPNQARLETAPLTSWLFFITAPLPLTPLLLLLPPLRLPNPLIHAPL